MAAACTPGGGMIGAGANSAAMRAKTLSGSLASRRHGAAQGRSQSFGTTTADARVSAASGA